MKRVLGSILCVFLTAPVIAVAQAPPTSTASAGVPEALEPPVLTGEAVANWKPSADEPPELSTLKLRILKGENGTLFLKDLQKLSYKYAKSAEIPYLLGQLYLEKLWVGDGLKLLRKAIELDGRLRANPFLIRAAINSLGNDGEAARVKRFLVQDIGPPAAPYLEEVLYGEWRQQVKDRAAATLRELQTAPM